MILSMNIEKVNYYLFYFFCFIISYLLILCNGMPLTLNWSRGVFPTSRHGSGLQASFVNASLVQNLVASCTRLCTLGLCLESVLGCIAPHVTRIYIGKIPGKSQFYYYFYIFKQCKWTNYAL